MAASWKSSLQALLSFEDLVSLCLGNIQERIRQTQGDLNTNSALDMLSSSLGVCLSPNITQGCFSFHSPPLAIKVLFKFLYILLIMTLDCVWQLVL